MISDEDELAEIARASDARVTIVPAGLRSQRGRPPKTEAPRDGKGRILSSFYESKEGRAAARAARKERRDAENARKAEDARKVARWIRMREVITALCADPRLGTQMGRMFLLGNPLSIAAREFEAGRRFGNLLAAYDAVVLDASRTARAINPNSAGGRPLGQELSPEIIEGIKQSVVDCERALVNAQEAAPVNISAQLLVRHDGSEALKRVVAVKRGDVLRATQALVRGEELADKASLDAGVRGLEALVELWKLGDLPEAKIRRAGEILSFDPDGRVREFMIVRASDQ